MSSSPSAGTCNVVYYAAGLTLPRIVNISLDWTVVQLAKVIFDDAHHWPGSFNLYKVPGKLFNSLTGEALQQAVFNYLGSSHASPLPPLDTVAACFADTLHDLCVVAVNTNQLHSRVPEVFIPLNVARYQERQNANVQALRRTPFSSSKTRRNYNRPGDPPIGLFHDVFNHIGMDPKHMNGDSLVIPAYYCLPVSEYVGLSSAYYETSHDRMSGIHLCLQDLLGTPLGMLNTNDVVVSDAVVHACTDHSPRHVPALILAVINEFSVGEETALSLASAAYQKFWSSESNDFLRQITYCPTLLVAIAGPWLCVAGGVYLDKPNIQLLTNYNWTGARPEGNASDTAGLERLFSSLRKAVKTIQEYYAQLSAEDTVAVPPVCGFPAICEYTVGDRRVSFLYMEQLGISDDGSTHGTKLVYKVRLNSQDNSQEFRVVKFAARYNAQAHTLLAATEGAAESFAPRLHYVSSRLYGGRKMVVMDYVEGRTALEIADGLSEQQYHQLQQAVGRLHARGLVFGDITPSNILVSNATGRVLLVDFDFCGKEGEVRYPSDLDLDPSWPDGVGPGSAMKKAHDEVMLKRLCPFSDVASS
ncbi:hypothetical protein BDY19DRAFT_998832 [Irpex rosettiformis]|uniref:Uncharacterized protein n=1 Tax=Irpex rosettiformis TaxID=378272 RepID=A0ACB8TM90_9APHY|nr:hypothetical protein BDY19DRAFT_998832 [Irpex rosettiformis]